MSKLLYLELIERIITLAKQSNASRACRLGEISGLCDLTVLSQKHTHGYIISRHGAGLFFWDII